MVMKYILYSKKKQKHIIKIILKNIQNYTAGAGDDAVTHKVTGILWEIDDKSYPPTNFKFKFDNTENKTTIPFNNYIDICMKHYRVSSPILGKIDFQNLYNIYGINAQNFTPLVYVVTKVEKHIIIDTSKSTGEGSKSTTLSLTC